MISELKEGERIAEFHLGADDWLVLSCDKPLDRTQRQAIVSQWQRVIETPGRKVVVLDAGLRLQVVHADASRSESTEPDEGSPRKPLRSQGTRRPEGDQRPLAGPGRAPTEP